MVLAMTDKFGPALALHNTERSCHRRVGPHVERGSRKARYKDMYTGNGSTRIARDYKLYISCKRTVVVLWAGNLARIGGQIWDLLPLQEGRPIGCRTLASAVSRKGNLPFLLQVYLIPSPTASFVHSPRASRDGPESDFAWTSSRPCSGDLPPLPISQVTPSSQYTYKTPQKPEAAKRSSAEGGARHITGI